MTQRWCTQRDYEVTVQNVSYYATVSPYPSTKDSLIFWTISYHWILSTSPRHIKILTILPQSDTHKLRVFFVILKHMCSTEISHLIYICESWNVLIFLACVDYDMSHFCEHQEIRTSHHFSNISVSRHSPTWIFAKSWCATDFRRSWQAPNSMVSQAWWIEFSQFIDLF